MARNGILCLEGDWEEGLARRRTVRPVLELLKSQWNIPFIHRNASTREEFRSVLGKWSTARYQDFRILYLAFHGVPGHLKIEDEIVPILDLHELFRGGARGRFIHFGACETVSTKPGQLRDFLRRSGFAGLCGFREDVDWLEACALELVVLNELATHKLSARGLSASRDRINAKARSLARHLDFRFYTRGEL